MIDPEYNGIDNIVEEALHDINIEKDPSLAHERLKKAIDFSLFDEKELKEKYPSLYDIYLSTPSNIKP